MIRKNRQKIKKLPKLSKATVSLSPEASRKSWMGGIGSSGKAVDKPKLRPILFCVCLYVWGRRGDGR